jgi:hypothetical protein
LEVYSADVGEGLEMCPDVAEKQKTICGKHKTRAMGLLYNNSL